MIIETKYNVVALYSGNQGIKYSIIHPLIDGWDDLYTTDYNTVYCIIVGEKNISGL